MKKILFAIGALALLLTATAPAHADYAIVKFNSGYCRIWTDTVARYLLGLLLAAAEPSHVHCWFIRTAISSQPILGPAWWRPA